MTETAVQLQTFRDLDEPIPTQLERIAETSLTGVEFAGLDDTPVDAIASALVDTGLTPVGAHVGIDRIERDYEAVTETYRALDCQRLVVPGTDPGAFRSADAVRATADRLSRLGDRLADDGLELLYHNNCYEFRDPEATGSFDTFVDHLAPAVGLQVDTGLAKHGGVDPAALLERHRDRTSLVHLTDTVTGADSTRHVELGAGELDVERCVEAAFDADAEWLIYEHGRTSDPIDSLTHAATKMPQLSRRAERELA